MALTETQPPTTPPPTMQIDQMHTCPECSHKFDLVITLGDPPSFIPDECPECNREILEEEVELSESPEEENPFI